MKTIIIFIALLLSGCQALDPATMGSGVFCAEGLAGVKGFGVNIEKVVGTKGGGITIKCSAGEITFTDSGNLSPLGQSIRVPVESTPMKLTPAKP